MGRIEEKSIREGLATVRRRDRRRRSGRASARWLLPWQRGWPGRPEPPPTWKDSLWWRWGVVGLNVLFDARRDGLGGLAGEAVEQIGIGGVGERIAPGLHDASGVEIAVGERMARIERRMRCRRARGGRRKARQPLSKSGRGEHDAVKIFLLSGLGWPLDSNQLQRTDLGNDKQETR